ncbi:Zinc finger CCCH-type superfamily [Arabidopsis suecica]|uniref:Zinc finger CCCH-type superfamily n=1 Tax=Arabidopsis suecica TaxID=45249 RepID=A0A8T2BTF5_ARASU|nr:Zinc finger CCCH-type superfamily [Arabidopsis suecica]
MSTDFEDDGSDRILLMVERRESSKVGFRRCSPSPSKQFLERMEDNKILGGDLHKNLKRFEKNKNLEERLEGKRRKMGDLQPFASKQFLERMGDFNKNWERFENNRKLEMLEGKRRKMGDMQRLACQRLMCDQYSRLGHCKRGDRCPFLHGKPMKPLYRNISDNPELVAFMMKNGNMPACPPEDPTVKMLYVKRLSRTTLVEEDLQDCLSAYGDIESIRMVQEYNGAAFITYGTREAAEKCMEDLKTWVEIKGHKLKILWAYKYQPHRYTTISSNQQGAVTSTQEGASSSSSALEVKRRKIE